VPGQHARLLSDAEATNAEAASAVGVIL